MSAVTASTYPGRPGDPLDLVGLVAFAIAPALALYQGVTVALGILAPLDSLIAALVPVVGIAACLLARMLGRGRLLSTPAIRRATLYFVGYLVVVLISTLLVFAEPIERDPSRMLQQFLSTAAAMLIFPVLVSAPSQEAALRSLRIGLGVWAVAAILTPLTALTPLPIGEVQGAYQGSQGVRSFGVLGDGGTLVVSCLAVAFFVSRRFFWFALAIFALILSGSRIPLVVAAAGIAVAIILSTPSAGYQRPGSRAIRVVVASVGAALLLVAVQLVFAAVSQKLGVFNAFERLNETQFTQSDRFFSIAQGLEWIKLSPVYGSGFNSYYYFSLRSAAFGASQSNSLNQVIQTLVDGGALGLIFLALFFYEVIRPRNGAMFDRRRDPYGLRIWLLVFLVLNQTAVYILPAFYLTILIFGVSGIVLHAREAAVVVPSRRVPAPVPQ
jgi:hypothetical protein